LLGNRKTKGEWVGFVMNCIDILAVLCYLFFKSYTTYSLDKYLYV